MELGVFEERLARVRTKRENSGLSEDFKLFDFWVASEADLALVESELRVRLPGNYKEFMRRYGGGEFLFLDLLPAVSTGEDRDDLLGVNSAEFEAGQFVAISPVGTGDWWGFAVIDGVCQESISFWSHEDGQVEFSANDIFEFLVRRGLRED